MLRRVLEYDAVASGAMGTLLAVGADLLEAPLGVPAGFGRELGIGLVVYAAVVWLIAARGSRGGAGAVVGANWLWAVASVAVVVTGVLPLTGLGIAFVLAQAAVVMLLGDFQFMGLRRER